MPSNDPLDYLHTVGDFVRWGASRMNSAAVHFGHGTDSAVDEAASLVLHALHLPPDLPDIYLQAALTPEEKFTICDLLTRRIDERKPAPYLTGKAWFMGLPFTVDERVLIPRSPLAELIEQQFAPWLFEPESVSSMLDLCTGSGCIAVALAYAFENADVDATDLSAEALIVARRNIAAHEMDHRITAIQSDLFAGLEGRIYDVILSNPPYVSRAELSQLPLEFSHEPVLALGAGEQGLDIVAVILREAGNYLRPGGLLIVEVGNTQLALVETYPEVPFVWLEFERGGDGVFLLTAEQLSDHQHLFVVDS